MGKAKVQVPQETLLRSCAAIENAAEWLPPAKAKDKTLQSATPSASCVCQV